MKKMINFLFFPTLLFAGMIHAQTLYVPSGTAGIGTSTNGFIGIGTTATPPSLFTVQGNGTLGSVFQQKITNASQTLVLGVNATAAEIQSQGSVPLYLNYGGNNIIMNASGGNVGIGITVPSDKLTIGGGNLGIFGAGLDGSTYQRTVIYSDATNGLYFDAPKNSAGTKMNVQFNWRGGGIPALLNQGTSGNIGIGTTQPDYKLTVNGKIKAEELQVVVDVPADYVFEKNYPLMPLFELEKYVIKNNHLPGVPDGKTIIKNGWQVGEMNNKLLEKVEELTLYMIQLKKENEALKIRLHNLERKK